MTLLVGERRGEKLANERDGPRGADLARAEADDVGIVVAPALAGGELVVHERGADAPELVGCDRRPNPAPAHENAHLDELLADRVRGRASEVGIVHRLVRKRAHVEHVVAIGLERVDNGPLVREPRVITTECDAHGISTLSMSGTGPGRQG